MGVLRLTVVACAGAPPLPATAQSPDFGELGRAVVAAVEYARAQRGVAEPFQFVLELPPALAELVADTLRARGHQRLEAREWRACTAASDASCLGNGTIVVDMAALDSPVRARVSLHVRELVPEERRRRASVSYLGLTVRVELTDGWAVTEVLRWRVS